MDTKLISRLLADSGQPAYRYQQICKAVFKDGVSSLDEISSIPKHLREALRKAIPLLSFTVEKVLVGRNKDNAKALLCLKDGNLIETVLISPKPGMWSVCISCQVGCAMGCRFCATGAMGFVRDLTAEEITDQVLFWKQYLKKSAATFGGAEISTIVYMGMGEPFNNWENVRESLRIFNDPENFAIGWRNLSVSTSGVVAGIKRFAKEFPQVNLAVSLHFASDAKRSDFMPVNRGGGLEKLREALREYFILTKRKVFLEYIMLEGINDTKRDADELAAYIHSIGSAHLLHVNLIRYNMTSSRLEASSQRRATHFKNMLKDLRVNATIRKSLGDEISGACGQLAGK